MKNRIQFVDDDPLGRRLRAEAMADQPEFSASLYADIMKAVQIEDSAAVVGRPRQANVRSAWRWCAASFAAALLLVSVVVSHINSPDQAYPAGDSATRQAMASADIAAKSAAEELDQAAQSAVHHLDSLALVHWNYVERNGSELASFLLDSFPVDSLPMDASPADVPHELATPTNR